MIEVFLVYQFKSSELMLFIENRYSIIFISIMFFFVTQSHAWNFAVKDLKSSLQICLCIHYYFYMNYTSNLKFDSFIAIPSIEKHNVDITIATFRNQCLFCEQSYKTKYHIRGCIYNESELINTFFVLKPGKLS